MLRCAFQLLCTKARQNGITKNGAMSERKIKMDGGRIQNTGVIPCLINGIRLWLIRIMK